MRHHTYFEQGIRLYLSWRIEGLRVIMELLCKTLKDLLKEQTSLLKDEIKELNFNLEIAKNKVDTHKKYIRDT